MTLNGSQHKQLHKSLVEAFDQAGLALLLRQELNQDLDAVAGGKDRNTVVLNLIAWAERQNCVGELIAGALRENPQNAQLVTLAQAAESWNLAPSSQEGATPPYQGLAFFDVGDVGRFFGREVLTAELTAMLRSHRFLAVVGASGSGKSSVVRAGVIPAIHAGAAILGSSQWSVVTITPTSHPLKALAAALTQDATSLTVQATLMDDFAKEPRSLDLLAARWAAKTGAPRLVIVVDQFEELFSLCQDGAERRQFVDNLLTAAAPDGLTTVIITLRADFYVHCAEFENLRAALEKGQRYIGPMSREELRAAIEKPALQGGWELEPQLADQMLDDVAEQPGALPLLSHALMETWKRRHGRRLLHAGYAAAGGVSGAIAHTAEELFVSLSEAEQTLAHHIFTRLTFVGEDVQTLRRRVPLAELIHGEQAKAMASLLIRLQDVRLVTTGKSPSGAQDPASATIYVEVTHEAVIREWPRLRTWIDENRLWLRVHQMINDDCKEWAQGSMDASYLYGSRRLDQAMQWAAGRASELSSDERLFLAQSLVAVGKQDGATGRYERACERLHLAAELQPKLVAAYLELYTLAIDQHDFPVAFQSFQDLQRNEPGRGLLPSRFVAERIVDVSDFGPVYLCRDANLPSPTAPQAATGGSERLVAVTLARWNSAEQEGVAAQLLARYGRLQCQHINPLLDIGYWQDRYFLVSKFVTGDTLKSRLDRGDVLPPEEVLPLISAIGAALAAGHAHQLTHLGLQPANVLRIDGKTMLVRYGEARLHRELLGPGAPPSPATPYLAPEQRRGEAGDAASDIYTLGALANQLLTGQSPDERQTMRPSHSNKRYDLAIDEWVARATGARPAARFSSMARMVDEWNLISNQARGGLLAASHRSLAVLDHGAQMLRRGRLRYAIFLLAGLTLVAEALLPLGPVHHITRFILLLIPVAYLLGTLFYWQALLKARQTGDVALIQTGAGSGLVVAALFTTAFCLWAHSGGQRVMAGGIPTPRQVALFLVGATLFAVTWSLIILLTLQFADRIPFLRSARSVHVVYVLLGLWCVLLTLALVLPWFATPFYLSV